MNQTTTQSRRSFLKATTGATTLGLLGTLAGCTASGSTDDLDFDPEDVTRYEKLGSHDAAGSLTLSSSGGLTDLDGLDATGYTISANGVHGAATSIEDGTAPHVYIDPRPTFGPEWGSDGQYQELYTYDVRNSLGRDVAFIIDFAFYDAKGDQTGVHSGRRVPSFADGDEYSIGGLVYEISERYVRNAHQITEHGDVAGYRLRWAAKFLD